LQPSTMEHPHPNLKHVTSLLSRWRGADAKLWEYSVSHKSLIIRLTSSSRAGNLHLRCGDVESISALTAWSDAQVEVQVRDEGSYLISDVNAGLRIVAFAIDVAEDCK
jgi:hypothetical protein